MLTWTGSLVRRRAFSARAAPWWFMISRPAKRSSTEPGSRESLAQFVSRHPFPPHEAQELSPEILAHRNSGFRLASGRWFEIGITLSPGFYLEYMLTETNVAHAVRTGTPYAEIRSWCADTLRPVWEGKDREVKNAQATSPVW